MQFVQTRDHSHTLYIPELDETYHSRNGAIEEAMYVYIGRGLRDLVRREESAVRSPQSAVELSEDEEESTVYCPPSTAEWSEDEDKEESTVRGPQSAVELPEGENTIDIHNKLPDNPILAQQRTADCGPRTADSHLTILEVGFGTGLNAWLTALECSAQQIHCIYHTLETYPLPMEIISQLNYTEKNQPEHKQLFTRMHEVPWNQSTALSPFFGLTKFEQSLQKFETQQGYDMIYFDAFAPEKQPEMWTEEVFRKLYDCLNPGGVIVTYSAKGEIRRLWKNIGFEVERLPGPPFKRHMLRGRKNA